MQREVLDFDRLEGTRADVQRNVRKRDAALAQALEHRLVEMQAGRGRRDRARVPCINGLIALAVLGLRRARYIRRQRDLAVTIEIGGERDVGGDSQAKEPPFTLEHRRPCASVERKGSADLGRMAGGELHPRFVVCDDALEQDLDSAAAVLAAMKARANDFGVVEDEQVPGREQLGQVRERAIVELRAGDVQQAARGA